MRGLHDEYVCAVAGASRAPMVSAASTEPATVEYILYRAERTNAGTMQEEKQQADAGDRGGTSSSQHGNARLSSRVDGHRTLETEDGREKMEVGR